MEIIMEFRLPKNCPTNSLKKVANCIKGGEKVYVNDKKQKQQFLEILFIELNVDNFPVRIIVLD